MAERFWPKVDKRGPSDCWRWNGAFSSGRYGFLWVDGRRIAAHRVSLMIAGKNIDGLVVDHLCRNVKCVNPHHLEAVTQRENVLRSDTIYAENMRKNKCGKGHPFTTDNTYVYTYHKRVCRTCARAAYKRHMKKKYD